MKNIEKIANEKKTSRDIVATIIDFGVNESQKIDVIYYLALTLNDNNKMKEICNFLKKYTTEINNQKEENKIILP